MEILNHFLENLTQQKIYEILAIGSLLFAIPIGLRSLYQIIITPSVLKEKKEEKNL